MSKASYSSHSEAGAQLHFSACALQMALQHELEGMSVQCDSRIARNEKFHLEFVDNLPTARQKDSRIRGEKRRKRNTDEKSQAAVQMGREKRAELGLTGAQVNAFWGRHSCRGSSQDGRRDAEAAWGSGERLQRSHCRRALLVKSNVNSST